MVVGSLLDMIEDKKQQSKADLTSYQRFSNQNQSRKKASQSIYNQYRKPALSNVKSDDILELDTDLSGF
jgi:cell division GTPase FtsZ